MKILRNHYLDNNKPRGTTLCTELISLKLGNEKDINNILRSETAAIFFDWLVKP